jgi:hypothetical protein
MFEANRAQMGSLYQEGSLLTFEGQKFQGAQAIATKLAQLPFAQCKVTAASMDFQPSVSGGIIVFVTGSILVRPRARARAGRPRAPALTDARAADRGREQPDQVQPGLPPGAGGRQFRRLKR